jgi:hypothetical protein
MKVNGLQYRAKHMPKGSPLTSQKEKMKKMKERKKR